VVQCGALCIAHCALCTVHLCIVHCALCIVGPDPLAGLQHFALTGWVNTAEIGVSVCVLAGCAHRSDWKMAWLPCSQVASLLSSGFLPLKWLPSSQVAPFLSSGSLPLKWLPSSHVASFLSSGFLPLKWLPSSQVASFLSSGFLPLTWLPSSQVAPFLSSGFLPSAFCAGLRACRARVLVLEYLAICFLRVDGHVRDDSIDTYNTSAM
jgi:hypothetical protein